jgi:hypothetical protein
MFFSNVHGARLRVPAHFYGSDVTHPAVSSTFGVPEVAGGFQDFGNAWVTPPDFIFGLSMVMENCVKYTCIYCLIRV